ncbi:hypothetical protein AAY473_028224 [Plecturocebus cupreus]
MLTADSGLALFPRLEYSGMIPAHCSLDFLGSKTGFCHVSQAVLEFLGSSSPPTLASQSIRITGRFEVYVIIVAILQTKTLRHKKVVGTHCIQLTLYSHQDALALSSKVTSLERPSLNPQSRYRLPGYLLFTAPCSLPQNRVSLCCSGWSAMAWSRLTAASVSQAEVIPLPTPAPKVTQSCAMYQG